MRYYYTCTGCGETFESKMSRPPTPCSSPKPVLREGMCNSNQVRLATPDEIEQYERMFVEW